jgi:hypothetical protein
MANIENATILAKERSSYGSEQNSGPNEEISCVSVFWENALATIGFT